MALSVQPYSTPNVVTNGPGKAQFYGTIGQAAQQLSPGGDQNALANKFANNPYGVSYQEIQSQIRNNAPGVTAASPATGSGSIGATGPNYAALQAGFNDQKNNIINSESASGTTAHRDISGSILDLVDQLTQGQNKINNDATQNYLAKQQGTAGVLSMIQHGLQSGAVTLANKNATNSSASEALARAYGDIGRRAQSQVGNQFAQGQNSVNLEQQNQDVAKAGGLRHIQQTKQDTIDSIVQDARQRLGYIQSAMAGASLPTRLNLDQEAQNIRNTATAQLADLDQQLSERVNPIAANGEDARRVSASQLATAGTAAAAPFQYTTAGPAQFSNTGPFASQLPLFTLPGGKKQTG